MTTFDPKHPRGVYPGAAAMRPQYVLITENGEERTSNVTDARIFKAVYEIDSNEYVTLEKCQPIIIEQEASAFAISFYKDTRIAIYFRMGNNIMRMSDKGYTCEDAANMMCDFFRLAQLPDIHNWTCEKFEPARMKKLESNLTVDGEDFRHFDFTDVMAALENIRDGKSKWLHHGFNGEEKGNGYFHICRCEDAEGEQPIYKAEWVEWTTPEPTGYRIVTSNFNSLHKSLWDFSLNRKYPETTPEWERFDVTAYFQQLISKYSENDER